MTVATPPRIRLRLAVGGVVQGVGFRPFVHRLATELALAGWVGNSPQGVVIEIEGPRSAVEEFACRLRDERPAHSVITSCESVWLDAVGWSGFAIRPSETVGAPTALVLPDIAPCAECRRELFDPANRRFRYPFINCTHCGPRFSIIEALPYDRPNTTMRGFALCAACRAEYEDPRDRRFHAQPNACPRCGPRLELWDAEGVALFGGDDALRAAAQAIRRGRIVAVKGVGGFHLLVDARNAAAVQRLRERKRRGAKPFAVMFPTLAAVREVCAVCELEARLLEAPEAPIVLLARRTETGAAAIADAVAPGNPNLGVLLPANPLHLLLMAELGFPVVATSGNLSDEPLCTDEREALARLRGIADLWLVHDRPIARPVDDSIVRVMLDREMVLRRARGYAPLPMRLPSAECRGAAGKSAQSARPATRHASRVTVLAVGAHLKNTVALAVGENVFLSQHLGDLETEPAHAAFRRAAADLPRLYAAPPEVVAADLHPDYLSTQFAEELAARRGGPRLVRVQHHLAHALACLAENEVALPALGVAWDGTGYGEDGAIWGGEFFRVADGAGERVASLRAFPLPGGDAAAREPRRAALGLLHAVAGGDAALSGLRREIECQFAARELALVQTALERGVNAPPCSSVGRLFDAVAALLGLRARNEFEGQAAMELEFAAAGGGEVEPYDLPLVSGPGVPVLDWLPLLCGLAADRAAGVPTSVMAAKFHEALAAAVVAVARAAGENRVALSGGCFQNRRLTERTVTRLRAAGFAVYWHQRLPPNDGGIALGQVVAARRPAR
jgi:hydrogenase maturation protein HypF